MSSPVEHSHAETALRELIFDHGHMNVTNDIQVEETAFAVIGGYVDIYRGTYKTTGKRCAVKIFRRLPRQVNKKTVQQFITRYFAMWAKFRHPNVINLEGFLYDSKLCGDDTWNIAFVSVLQENGTVLDYLTKNPKGDVGQIVSTLCLVCVRWSLRLSIHQALGAANGIQYLHKEHIVHCNIKSVRCCGSGLRIN